jgi:hypothetical protein
MGKMGEYLPLKLWPIPSGNHGYLGDIEKVAQKRRHLGVQRRFTFGKRTVEIENNQLFHSLSIHP